MEREIIRCKVCGMYHSKYQPCPSIKEETKMEWKPWEKYREEPLKMLPIYEPPCKDCRLWYPHVEYDTDSEIIAFNGIRCCRSDKMQNDFSCYREKNEK